MTIDQKAQPGSVQRSVSRPAELVLSLFPGIGVLDMAFEQDGFCLVRGPDLIWGGDVRRFHPPAGVFSGLKAQLAWLPGRTRGRTTEMTDGGQLVLLPMVDWSVDGSWRRNPLWWQGALARSGELGGFRTATICGAFRPHGCPVPSSPTANN